MKINNKNLLTIINELRNHSLVLMNYEGLIKMNIDIINVIHLAYKCEKGLEVDAFTKNFFDTFTQFTTDILSAGRQADNSIDFPLIKENAKYVVLFYNQDEKKINIDYGNNEPYEDLQKQGFKKKDISIKNKKIKINFYVKCI